MADNAEASRWLLGRGLDVGAVAAWDLARVLRLDSTKRSWAYCGRRPWFESEHRLLLRMYDHEGAPRSLRARHIGQGTPRLKSLAPSGCALRGLIMADPLGVQLLRGPRAPTWWSGVIVVVEGEPDFLTWAARQSESREDGPAVFGLVSGSWSAEVARRIPSGARVAVRAHADAAGQSFADTVERTLAARCHVEVLRGGAG